MATIPQSALNPPTERGALGLIQIDDVHKYYDLGETKVHALRGVNVRIERGEFVAIMGASGSGKSTFMNILGCLDKPTTGRYLLEGIAVSESPRRNWRPSATVRSGSFFRDSTCFPAPPRWKMLSCPRSTRRSARKKAGREHVKRSSLWAWATAWSTSLLNFRVVSSSGSQLPAGWSIARLSCWPTSPPAIWTAGHPWRFWKCFKSSMKMD